MDGDQFIQEMDAGVRELRRLHRNGQLTLERCNELARKAAAAFTARRLTAPAEAMRLLCEIATLDDETLSRPGLVALFSEIIEPLADSFEPQDCATYYSAFAQVIQFCRRLPAGRRLNDKLSEFGLTSESDFSARMKRVTAMKKFDLTQARQIKKALVLSRVTLGADVEITSIVWQKLKQTFPSAEIVLLASDKAGELFGGDSMLRLRTLNYHRGGRLIDRLSSWLNVVAAAESECQDLRPDEFLIVDPDSRLTQLGLLPVMPDESQYYFFESRSYQNPGLSSLGQLTAQWLSEVFGGEELLYPCVRLRPDDTAFAEAFIARLQAGGARYITSLNFGVGENLKKRVPGPLEPDLVLRLLQHGDVIILDKGMGAEEASRVDAIVNTVKQQGKRVTEVNEHNTSALLQSPNLHADMVTWQGGIGRFSALVAQTDRYIGYDSAGQHIAAALGIPTVVIFAGYDSRRFVERWQPAGRGIIKSVLAPAQHPAGYQLALFLDEVIQAVKEC